MASPQQATALPCDGGMRSYVCSPRGIAVVVSPVGIPGGVGIQPLVGWLYLRLQLRYIMDAGG